jgi:prolyl-tRNA synthetase
MGCYGIGSGRTAAAAVEQNHDDKGIVWPFPIAPFHVHLISLGQSTTVIDAATKLYAALEAVGLEVLWDDRDERAGVKFNDADLIGAPYQVIVGDKGLAEGVGSEIPQHRRETKLAPTDVPPGILAILRDDRPPDSTIHSAPFPPSNASIAKALFLAFRLLG